MKCGITKVFTFDFQLQAIEVNAINTLLTIDPKNLTKMFEQK